MTEEQIQAIVARSEADYELLKDTVHDQYDMIQDLKDINELHQKLNGELREQLKATEELARLYKNRIARASNELLKSNNMKAFKILHGDEDDNIRED